MKCWGFPHVSTLFVAAKNPSTHNPPSPRIHHSITASHPAWPRRRKPTTSSSNSKPTWRSWCFFQGSVRLWPSKKCLLSISFQWIIFYFLEKYSTSTLCFFGGLSGVGIAINQLLGLERGALCVHRWTAAWIVLFCRVARKLLLGIF